MLHACGGTHLIRERVHGFCLLHCLFVTLLARILLNFHIPIINVVVSHF